MATLQSIMYVGIGILVLIIIIFVILYRLEGIIAGILEIGFIATLLLVIRYTNCIISPSGIVGVGFLCLFQVAFMAEILKNRKKQLKLKISDFRDVYFKYLKIGIPVILLALVYTFSNWLPISSLGMILFWGSVLFTLYNFIITKILIYDGEK